MSLISVYPKRALLLIVAAMVGQAGWAGECQSRPSELPNGEVKRHIVYTHSLSWFSDPDALVGPLDASDCGDGYVINNLAISLKIEIPGVYGSSRHGLSCYTNIHSYSPTVPDFSALRAALNDSNNSGIWEISDSPIGAVTLCSFRYYRSIADLQAAHKDVTCNGRIGVDLQVDCVRKQ